jgi:molecular chaperone DnaK (HSP70)
MISWLTLVVNRWSFMGHKLAIDFGTTNSVIAR